MNLVTPQRPCASTPLGDRMLGPLSGAEARMLSGAEAQLVTCCRAGRIGSNHVEHCTLCPWREFHRYRDLHWLPFP